MQDDMSMMLSDAYDAHDMFISQAFKEPESSSKDGNLRQEQHRSTETTYTRVMSTR